jgi:hypothetical protein
LIGQAFCSLCFLFLLNRGFFIAARGAKVVSLWKLSTYKLDNMDINCIFEKKGDCKLWAVCYKEDQEKGKKPIDIFRKLFNQWNDTAYLQNFFRDNQPLLALPWWRGMSISNAIDKVLDEAYDFELELRGIDTKQAGFDHIKLSDIFENFHNDMYVLDGNNLYHKKGKPRFGDSMIRIYALEFDNGYIVTGGLIKLTHKLEQKVADEEIEKIDRVKQYLDSEGIFSRQGLDEI